MSFKRVLSYLLAICMLITSVGFTGAAHAEASNSYKLPRAQMVGEGFTLSGNINMSYTISWAKVYLISSKTNKTVQTTSYKANAKKINLYNFNKGLNFRKLQGGYYRIKVIAKSAYSGKWYRVMQRSFTVSDIKAPNNEHPYNVSQGTKCFASGKIVSLFGLKEVAMTVRDRNGNVMQSASMTTKGRGRTVFDMKNFQKAGVTLKYLRPGTYTYYVHAIDSKGRKLVVRDHYLDVIGGRGDYWVKDQTLPGNLYKGKPFSLYGKVEGKRRIRKLRAMVKDSSGRLVSGFDVTSYKSLGSNRKDSSYQESLRGIDWKVKFDKLKPGRYTYILRVGDRRGVEYRLTSKDFTVSSILFEDVKLVNDKATTIAAGSRKRVSGNIISAFKLSRVSAYLEDSKGKIISGTYQTHKMSSRKTDLDRLLKPIPMNLADNKRHRLSLVATDNYGRTRYYRTSYRGSDVKKVAVPLPYGSRKLAYNTSNFRSIGKQPMSGPCGCYCMAYGRMVIDGSYDLDRRYPSYYEQIKAEYGRGGHSAHWWYAGAEAQWTSTASSAYKLAFDQINSGKPVIVPVDTSWNSNHFILLIGYLNGTKRENVRLNNFVILDPANGKEIKLWQDSRGYRDKSPGNTRILKFNY